MPKPLVELLDVYGVVDYEMLLWALLAEREPEANISHKAMPTWQEHVEHVLNWPHRGWWFIAEPDPSPAVPAEIYGSCYVSLQDELGIQIFKKHQRRGYASAALAMLIARLPQRRLLANISPANERSIALFRRYGFEICQYTYERKPS